MLKRVLGESGESVEGREEDRWPRHRESTTECRRAPRPHAGTHSLTVIVYHHSHFKWSTSRFKLSPALPGKVCVGLKLKCLEMFLRFWNWRCRIHPPDSFFISLLLTRSFLSQETQGKPFLFLHPSRLPPHPLFSYLTIWERYNSLLASAQYDPRRRRVGTMPGRRTGRCRWGTS